MADPNSLAIGDTVRHAQWGGQTAKVERFTFFSRFDAKKRRPVEDRGVRIVWLDRPMRDEDGYEEIAWMEAGLERVEG